MKIEEKDIYNIDKTKFLIKVIKLIYIIINLIFYIKYFNSIAMSRE